MNIGIGGFDPTILLLVAPLVVIELVLLVIAVADLLRDDRRVRGGSKPMWALIIVFVNLIGPILYLLVGRDESPLEPGEPGEPGPGAVPGWGSPHDPPIVVGPGAGRSTPGVPADVAAPGPTAPSPAAEPGATSQPRPEHPVMPRPEGPAAISIDGLSKRYPGGVLALDGLTMSVPQGSVFGLLGPNGAGKTTCLRLLAGLTRATSGGARVSGTIVSADSLAVRRGLGYLEQDPRTYSWLTGREQLLMLGRLHGMRGDALERAVADVLARVDLASAADRRTGTYSGGMRQRLGIAGALVHRPPVVIMDEPVSALDPEGRRDVLELVTRLSGETTVLFSTHVLADVERVCDRVGILDHGRLVVEGPLAELLDRYALPVYRIEAEPGQAAAMASLAERLRGLSWVTGAAVDHGLLTVAVSDPAVAARELLGLIAAEDLAVIAVARARPTLEDVFLSLTGDGGEQAA